MRYGFDYITSGNYAGDWQELFFPVDSVVTLTTNKGDSFSGVTFSKGQSIVGPYEGISVTSGAVIAYKRSDTEKRALFDSATSALLSQATTDGYTAASGSTLTALDTMIKSLKADGIWDKLDIMYVFATNGDSDFATYNILDPSSFQATKVNAPTFTSLEGFTGDGATSYLDTNYNASTDATNYLLNSASFGGYYRSLGASSEAFIGSSGANHIERFTTTYRFEINGSDTTTYSLFPAGFFFANRDGAASAALYSNGALDQADNHSSSAVVNANFHALNNNSASFSSAQVSIAFAGGDLSAEASDFYTAVQTYMTALGTEV